MLIVKYTSLGTAYSDFGIADIVDEFLKKYNYDFKTHDMELSVSTENFIYALKLLVATRKINYEDIIFKYKDKEITMDKYGALNEIAKGFIDCEQNILDDIVRANFNE